MLKEQVRHNMELARARKHKSTSICFDIEKTKRDDTMDRFFEGMANEDKTKYIRKSECIDEGFLAYLKSVNPYRQELHKEHLNDKLFMLHQVDKISHDSKLRPEIGIIMQRLNEINRANAQLEKHAGGKK